MAFDKLQNQEVVARTLFASPLESTRLYYKKLSDSKNSSDTPVNGEEVTILGTGFGIGPNVFLFDNLSDSVYDTLNEGDLIPTTSAGDTEGLYFGLKAGAPTLYSEVDTFGDRRAVMHMPQCNGTLIGANGCNDVLDANSKYYVRAMYKTTGQVFDFGAKKYLRVWTDTDGLTQPRVSYESKLLGSSGVTNQISGFAPVNMWYAAEQWLDGDTGYGWSKYFNIVTQELQDPVLQLPSPSTSGFRIQALGIDDGNGALDGFTGLQSDIYIADSLKAIFLCSSSDFKNALYKDIQVPTSWNDGTITYTRDAQQVSPANHWELVVDMSDLDNPVTLSSTKVGNPIEVLQEIRRPAYTTGNAAIAWNSGQGPSISGDWNLSFKFIGTSGEMNSTSFCVNGFNSKIIYYPPTKTWDIRIGNGTEFFGETGTADIIDGQEHTIVCQKRGSSFQIFIDGSTTPELDLTGTLNTFELLFHGAVARSGGDIDPCFWMWDLMFEDLTVPANSTYLKLDEQVGGIDQGAYRIYDSSKNEFITTIRYIGNWEYLPNEGY